MSDQLARTIRRPGALPALVTAAGILATLLVLNFVGALLTTVQFAIGQDLQYAANVWWGEVRNLFAGPLPFAIGVFLGLWQVAPIAGSLRLAHVVTRALLAGLIGVAVQWVLTLVVGFVVALVSAGWSGDLGAYLGAMLSPVALLFNALHTYVAAVPVVVLGAVFLWGWLQRHPSKVTPVGTLDEV